MEKRGNDALRNRAGKRFGTIVFGPMGLITGSEIRQLPNIRFVVVVFSSEHRFKKGVLYV
jgi:hypothetical protein|tara:strand:- start:708 stop:887 length:180 start_codon:yes stop_codon:yes gene_type:complete